MPVGPTPEQLKALGFAPPGGTGPATPDQQRQLGFETAAAPAPAAGPKPPDFLDRLGMAGGLSGLFHTAKDIFTGEPGAREGFTSGAGEAAQEIGPTAVRMGSGVLGAEGMLPGALIAGGGEGLAQMLEKGTIDPRQLDKARIAVATGTGAIPFGKIAQEGRVATSALRGGALAGGGETAREALSGEHFDPRAVGTATALGAAGAGGASKLGTMFGISPKLGGAVEGEAAAAPKAASTSAQQSALRRQVNQDIPKVSSGVKREPLPSGAREFDLGPIESPGIGVEQRPPAAIGQGVPQMGTPAEASGRVQKVIEKEAAEEAYIRAAAEKAAAAREKAALKAGEQTRIEDYIASEGRVPDTASITEGASGERRMSIPWRTPEPPAAPTAPAPVNPNYPRGYKDVPTDVFPEGPAPTAAPKPTGPVLVPPPTPPAEPESALLKFFRSPAGAAGENYGGAKLAEKAGEIPSADEAYNAFARERAALGQETAPRTQPQAAASTAPVSPEAAAPNWVQDQTDLVDAATSEPTLRDRLLNLAKSEQGSVPLPSTLTSDRAKRLLGAGAGAAIGAPIGNSAYGEEDDYGALKGALAGGLVGYNAGQGLNNLVNYRNSMLLASPSPVSKNILGDMGGMVGETLKQAMTPGQSGYAKDLFKNLPFVSPRQYGRDYLSELLHPEGSTASSMQDVASEALDKPMELIYRPFGASNVAIRKAMERAGAPHRVIEEASGISTPETKAFQSWLGMQQHPAFRYLFPFQKIAANVAEGTRNIPGVSLVAGNPADKWQRTAMGGLQMALGSGSELYDEAQAEEGTPTSNWTKGVRPNLLGPKYIAPFAAGQALTAFANKGPAKALTELVSMVPGARATLPAQFPNESADAYATRVLSGPISQMVPGFLKPDPGSVR